MSRGKKKKKRTYWQDKQLEQLEDLFCVRFSAGFSRILFWRENTLHKYGISSLSQNIETHLERKWKHPPHVKMKIFLDVLCRLRLLLEHMKLVRRNGHPIAGSVYIQYDGWCPVPPFNQEEVSLVLQNIYILLFLCTFVYFFLLFNVLCPQLINFVLYHQILRYFDFC